MRVLRADTQGLRRAAALVLEGQVVAFPTDTVYGLMALPGAAGRIYAVKRRPADKQLIAMAAGAARLEELVRFNTASRDLAARHWPGPLTLVLERRDGTGTLGVRVPGHPVALDLLREVAEPVLTTSANLSGEAPAMTAQAVQLEGVAAVLDGGRAPGGVPSTVADLTGERPRLIRAGPVNL